MTASISNDNMIKTKSYVLTLKGIVVINFDVEFMKNFRKIKMINERFLPIIKFTPELFITTRNAAKV